MVKLDKLGRRVPAFDRSEASKRAAQTRKERYGNDIYKKLGNSADHSRNRGYLGKLKDEGRIEELRAMAKKGQSKAYNHFSRLHDEGKTKELKAISKKGAEARKSKGIRSGRDKPVSGA